MKKKPVFQIITLLLILTVSALVSATLPNSNEYKAFYNGTIIGGEVIDSTGLYNLTNNGLTSYTDGTGKMLSANTTAYASGSNSPVTGENLTAFGWVNTLEASTACYRYLFFGQNFPNNLMNFYLACTGTDITTVGTNGGIVVQDTNDLNNGSWNWYAWTLDSTDQVRLWINGVNVANGTRAGLSIGTGIMQIFEGSNTYGNQTAIGLINRTLNNDELVSIYGEGRGYNPFTPPTTPQVNFVSPTPTDAYQEAYADFNLTINTTTSNIEGTINTSHYVYNSSGDLIGQNNETNGDGLYYSIFENIFSIGNYYFNASANNGTNLTHSETRAFQLNSTNAILNISFYSDLTQTLLSLNGTLNISNTPLGISSVFNITNGQTQFGIIKGYQYSLWTNLEGYALNTSIYTANNSYLQYLNLTLFTNNSVRINIFDETTGNLITDNISINFAGTNNYDFSTTNGTQYADNLTDGSYLISFTGTNYNLKQYLITVGSRSTQTLNAFLSASNSTTIFTYLDFDSSAIIQGATVSQLRLINGTWVIVDTKISDITGRVQFGYVPSIAYQFTSSATGYQTQTFTLSPILFNSYNVRLQKTTTLNPTNTPDNLGLSINYYTTGGGIAFHNNENTTLTWIISAPIGNLNTYSLNITYPGGFIAEAGSNAIGEQFTNTFQIDNANLTSTVTIAYCYLTTTSSEKCFSYPYSIIDAYGNQSFLANQDENYGLGELERTLIATVIITIISGAFYLFGGGITGLPVSLFLMYLFMRIGFIPLWGVLPSLLVGIIMLMGEARK